MPLSQKEEEEIKEEIIRLIDYNKDNWVKAAFFSDEVVEVIMESLYSKWSQDGEIGRPIDYATEDELKILHKRAKKYASMNTREAMRISLNRMGYEDKKEE
jgi:hypothetical protein